MIPAIPKIDDPKKYGDFDLPREKLEYALGEALKKIDFALPTFTTKFPSHSGKVYTPVENDGGWNCGFWTGILWHAYQMTGDEKYKKVAMGQIPGYLHRIENKIGVNHHDMGFVFIPSCVAAYKLTGDEDAKRAAVLAADNLISRYHEKGKFIQAWGNVDDPNSYRLIVDCLLNIPLLYWATEVTGDPKYAEMGYNHFRTTVEVCCRPDASTYHTYYFDPETGLPLRGATHQGKSDDSFWARGQAWGIYGPMLTYIYKKDPKALQTFEATTNFFLNHLPADYIAYWDMIYTSGTEEPRDSSADSIALCGMLEGIKHLPDTDPNKQIYINASKRIMNALIDTCLTKDDPESNGLLLHATYNRPRGDMDNLNIWGDYFYMEALHRMLNPDWELYW